MPTPTNTRLGRILMNAILAAVDSGDIGRMVAVEKIIEKESSCGLEGLRRTLEHDAHDFLMVAAPGFDRWLKLATGRNRDEWLTLASKLENPSVST